MSTIAERVAAGAAWLDEHEPGWVGRIDLDVLDVADDERCIAGQLRGSFGEAVAGWFGDRTACGTAADLGMCLSGMECDPRTPYAEWVLLRDAIYARLTAAWRELIAARRAEVGDRL